jgi:SAM-dependent methyltransferase
MVLVPGKMMTVHNNASADELIAEGEAVPVAGWDFSWFSGRASEERPPWGYAQLMAGRLAGANAAIDVQTGGGEVLSGVASAPPVLVATESWPPNVAVAKANLARVGGRVVRADDESDLPFQPESFDLVLSRHPTVTVWASIARVLRPGGSYLSQQVGAGSNRELTDFIMGPQPVSRSRSTARAVASAAAAGLQVTDLREQALRVEFFDVAAVVHFLRKVLWTVPGFTVARYQDRLLAMHEHIRAHGSFVCHSQRYLIEARKPD